MSQKLSPSQPTPKALLDAFSATLPNGFWKGWDELRFNHLASHPWPKTYFAPHHLVIEYLGRWLPDQALARGAIKAQTFGAWRAGQGIYRFDPEVYQSIVDMALPDALPVELFSKMPEWCVYIETPGMVLGDDVVYGFFASIKHQQEDSLLLVVHTEKSKIEAVEINLAKGKDIQACITQSVLFGYFFKAVENEDFGNIVERQAALLSPFLNLLLFVCTQASEIGHDQAKPSFPAAQKTRKGLRLFPPDKPQIWDVAVRKGQKQNHECH